MTGSKIDLPHNDEAEVGVLGSMMLDVEAADYATDRLSPPDYYHEAHGLIHDAIATLRERDAVPEHTAVRDELKRGGVYGAAGGDEHLVKIVETVPTAGNVRYWCRIVQEMALRRRLAKAGREVTEVALEGEGDAQALADEAEQIVFDVARRAGREDGELRPMKDLLGDAMSAIDEIGEHTTGTGLNDLDRMIGGFRPGELTLVAGRPSAGKSAIMVGVAIHVAMREHRAVGWWSLEMPFYSMVQRFLAARARVDGRKLSHGRSDEIAPDELKKLTDAADEFYRAPIHVAAPAKLTVTGVRAGVRRLQKQEGTIGIVVVDYVQLMDGTGETRNERIGSISRGLKSLAMEFDVPVVALSQLSRGVDKTNRRPVLSDLRDSGELENDADTVLFVHREAQRLSDNEAREQGVLYEADVIVGKQRNGPTGDVPLRFVPRYALFSDASHRMPA